MTTTEKDIVAGFTRGQDFNDAGNNNFDRLRKMVDEQWGPRPAAFSGLDYAYFGGSCWNGSAWDEAPDGTITLADDDTNYVERTIAGVVSTNTSGFTATKLPMAKVATASGQITAISDRRMPDIPGVAAASGSAGGVLAGTYPNPSFAADMATQAELDAAFAALKDGVSASFDTLAEIANELANKANLSGATFSGAVEVPDDAYDATTWNGNSGTPTKNAIRDKIESMGGGGASALEDLSDVVISSPSTNQVLKYDGTNWVNGASPSGGGGSGTGSALSITTNLSFWYKASNATLTGPRVTALDDDAASAGGVTLTQATALRQPFYNRNAYNNQPALAFNSVSYLLAASSPLTATDDWTIFVVVRPFITNNDASVRVILANGTGDTNGYVITANRDPNDTAHLISVLYPGVVWAFSDSAYYVGVPQIICAQRVAGTLSIYHNGRVTGNTYTNSPVTPTAFGIGYDSSSRKPYIGEFFEACGYNAALNSTDRGTVTADLGSAYNIPVE